MRCLLIRRSTRRTSLAAGGAIFHTSSGGDSDVLPTSLVNPDGSRVVVIENRKQDEIELRVEFRSGDAWSGRAAARSISTWVVPKAGGLP